MRTSTYVFIAGAAVAVVSAMPTILPDSISGDYDSNTNTGSGVLGFLDPIENKLPSGMQNLGVWIIAVAAVMRFGFGK